MIPCFSGEREAEGEQDKIDGKEESDVLLKGRGETEQLTFTGWRDCKIFRSRDPDSGLLGRFTS